jgi:hypothetical protein
MNWHTNIIIAALGAALASGCGGNYSNGDIDFQIAAPVREDLAVKLPRQQALMSGREVAEYYRVTRDGATTFNGFVDFITTLIDNVRVHPPSERHGDTRIWGPFPVREDPGFEVRVRMQRMAAVFYYWIDFRRGGTGDRWEPLISGDAALNPMGGGARRGRGKIVYDLERPRAVGYPVDPESDLLRLDVSYDRTVEPNIVDLTSVDVATTMGPGARGSYRYRENQDGSGTFFFVARPVGINGVQELEIRSRWLASGAGRADVRITEGFLALLNPGVIDCWGPDGGATFVRRTWQTPPETGDIATCVFPEPAPAP